MKCIQKCRRENSGKVINNIFTICQHTCMTNFEKSKTKFDIALFKMMLFRFCCTILIYVVCAFMSTLKYIFSNNGIERSKICFVIRNLNLHTFYFD